MKKVVKVFAGLILLIVILLGVLLFYIDHIAKTAVQVGATSALGVQTTVDAMDVSILAGSVNMDGLMVANPGGFTSEHFMTLGHSAIDVSLGLLMQDTVEVESLMLNGIDLYLEKKNGQANYTVIMDNMQKAESEPGQDVSAEKPGKKFVVRTITLTNINAHLDMPPMILKNPLHIDRISIKDYGSDTDAGVLMKQLSADLLKMLFQAIVEQGLYVLPELAGELSKGLEQLKDVGQIGAEVARGATQVLGQTIEETEQVIGGGVKVVEDIGKGLKEIGKGLGGLIKSGDKQKND